MLRIQVFFIIVISALLVTIAACSNLPLGARSIPINSNSNLAVKPQQPKTAEHIHGWSLSGSISIIQPQRSTIGTLSWTQYTPDTYYLLLYGPLSLGQVQIQGQPGVATLQQSGHPTVSASSAEGLILKQIGWTLPVSNLYYWVRGLPAPTSIDHKQFDNNQRLIGFNQQGWQIQYLGFQTINGIDLPTKIVATSPNLRMTLAIKHWTIAE